MVIFLLVIIVTFIYNNYSLKDQKIARGILRNMNIESVTNITIDDNDNFIFDLDGFNIKAYDPQSLEVDNIKIYCDIWIARKIYIKAYKIFNNDKIEKERMIRKDALIHFGNGK